MSLGIRNLTRAQFFDELGRKIDAIAPHDCMGLDLEILEQFEIRKLLNDWSVVAINDALKISDTTTPVIECDGYLVVGNIFGVSYVKHINI